MQVCFQPRELQANWPEHCPAAPGSDIDHFPAERTAFSFRSLNWLIMEIGLSHHTGFFFFFNFKDKWYLMSQSQIKWHVITGFLPQGLISFSKTSDENPSCSCFSVSAFGCEWRQGATQHFHFDFIKDRMRLFYRSSVNPKSKNPTPKLNVLFCLSSAFHCCLFFLFIPLSCMFCVHYSLTADSLWGWSECTILCVFVLHYLWILSSSARSDTSIFHYCIDRITFCFVNSKNT